jgi:enoyl-CoA hydratase/carnithine racemase
MSDLIRSSQREAIYEIVLNRPEKRNAIHWPMMEALSNAIDQAERAEGARVVILRGEGPVFSAGVDLAVFLSMDQHFGEGWQANLFPMTQAFQAVLNKVERCTLPVIALLHGHCLGLGLELALACDLRIAAAGTRMSLPEARLGMIPDVGGTTRLTRLVGTGRAKELIMTGRTFTAEDGERWGVINRLVDAESLQSAGDDLAGELIAAAPLAVSYAKKVIDGLSDLDRGLQLEAWAQSALIRSEDFATAIQAVLSQQPPEWKGR